MQLEGGCASFDVAHERARLAFTTTVARNMDIDPLWVEYGSCDDSIESASAAASFGSVSKSRMYLRSNQEDDDDLRQQKDKIDSTEVDVSNPVLDGHRSDAHTPVTSHTLSNEDQEDKEFHISGLTLIQAHDKDEHNLNLNHKGKHKLAVSSAAVTSETAVPQNLVPFHLRMKPVAMRYAALVEALTLAVNDGSFTQTLQEVSKGMGGAEALTLATATALMEVSKATWQWPPSSIPTARPSPVPRPTPPEEDEGVSLTVVLGAACGKFQKVP